MLTSLTIGTVKSMNIPDDWGVVPDDRQNLVQTLDGAVVIDSGHYAIGDKYTGTFNFRPEAWETVKGYWDARTLVDVTAPDGTTLKNRRVVVKSYTFQSPLFTSFVKAVIEFWGC